MELDDRGVKVVRPLDYGGADPVGKFQVVAVVIGKPVRGDVAVLDVAERCAVAVLKRLSKDEGGLLGVTAGRKKVSEQVSVDAVWQFQN